MHKDEGNDLFKKKKYREAISEYTQGIKQNSSDVTMNAVLFCNRATAHFYIGMYIDNEYYENVLISITLHNRPP